MHCCIRKKKTYFMYLLASIILMFDKLEACIISSVATGYLFNK